MSKTLLAVVSKFGKTIKLTKESYAHICHRHPEVTGEIGKIKKTLLMPQIIKKSMFDEKVWLFYRTFKDTPFTEKYLMVAARILNNEGFVITSYFTDNIKLGEEIWRES